MDKKSLQQIINHRLEKLEKIRNAGHIAYAYEYNKIDDIEDINNEKNKNIGDKVNTAGRIISQRKMGKASFIHIQDKSSKIQIYLKNDLTRIERIKNFYIMNGSNFFNIQKITYDCDADVLK